jgi:hypothetical protein
MVADSSGGSSYASSAPAAADEGSPQSRHEACCSRHDCRGTGYYFLNKVTSGISMLYVDGNWTWEGADRTYGARSDEHTAPVTGGRTTLRLNFIVRAVDSYR